MANTALPYSLLWLLLATCFVARVMSINDINSKCHKTELKSSRNYSTNNLQSKSRHLLYMASGGEHTHTHTLVT